MFSRGSSASAWRPLAVWATVTVAATGAVSAAPGAWRTAGASRAADGGADLLVAVCATGLALALAWLWVITTLTVLDVLTGRARAGGATRRLVLVACGAAVVAGTTVPAFAAGGDGRELLVGLALPERAVAPARHHQPVQPPPTATGTASRGETYVVRPGDSLWSVARLHPDATGSVDHRWRSIWRSNRVVIGDDPDLILPGQALRLPAPHSPAPHSPSPHSDGDR